MRPVSGGTDTHLALIDLRGVGVTGKDAEARCGAARIVLNKNSIPFDPEPPSVGSGIRVGTAGGHHAGHGRGRDEGGRRAHRAGRFATPTARQRGRWRRRSRPLVSAHPGLPATTEDGQDRARVRPHGCTRRCGHLPADAVRPASSRSRPTRSPRSATATSTPSRRRGSVALAMFAGICAGLLVASRLPTLHRVFQTTATARACCSAAACSCCSVPPTTAGASTR